MMFPAIYSFCYQHFEIVAAKHLSPLFNMYILLECPLFKILVTRAGYAANIPAAMLLGEREGKWSTATQLVRACASHQSPQSHCLKSQTSTFLRVISVIRHGGGPHENDDAPVFSPVKTNAVICFFSFFCEHELCDLVIYGVLGSANAPYRLVLDCW
jgi:hypothetical protein